MALKGAAAGGTMSSGTRRLELLTACEREDGRVECQLSCVSDEEAKD